MNLNINATWELCLDVLFCSSFSPPILYHYLHRRGADPNALVMNFRSVLVLFDKIVLRGSKEGLPERENCLTPLMIAAQEARVQAVRFLLLDYVPEEGAPSVNVDA